jgi:hypothetical protein
MAITQVSAWATFGAFLQLQTKKKKLPKRNKQGSEEILGKLRVSVRPSHRPANNSYIHHLHRRRKKEIGRK